MVSIATRDHSSQRLKNDDSPVGSNLASVFKPPGKLCFSFLNRFSDVLNQNFRPWALASLFLTSSPDDFQIASSLQVTAWCPMQSHKPQVIRLKQLTSFTFLGCRFSPLEALTLRMGKLNPEQPCQWPQGNSQSNFVGGKKRHHVKSRWLGWPYNIIFRQDTSESERML